MQPEYSKEAESVADQLESRKEVLVRICELLENYELRPQSAGFLRYASAEELRKLLDIDNEEQGSWERLFDWVEKYLKYSVKTHHKGFLNRMWEGANLPSLVGEIVTAWSNTSACTFESAPVSTVLEQYMLGRMLELVGFVNGEGQMTTGSSNANMIAMMAARNEWLATVKTKGLFNQRQLVGFISEDAHYSLEKAANIIGIGADNLLKIPVTKTGEMSIAALTKELEETVKQGDLPFFVAGTAGTTVRGAYDSIAELLRLRRRYSFWLHIDAAWGGAVLVSDSLRKQYMEGVEEVDSLTWDFHKMLGTALMCNVFLINNRVHTLGRVCSGGDASYIFHGSNENEVDNLGAVSLQCGRRVDALKWFLDWKFFTKEGFAARVEHSHELCRYAEEVVRRTPELELVYPRNSFNICFRYRAPAQVMDQLNLALRDTLYKNGSSLVGYAFSHGRPFLRLLLANHQLNTSDIDAYFAKIIETGRSLEVDYP